MEHLTYGWSVVVVKENLVGWIIFGLVFGVVNSFGIGFLLLPNAFRASKRAMQSGEAPEIGDLFNFDNIANDAVAMCIAAAVNFVGALLCGIGILVTAPLTFWVAHLAAEGRYAPMDAVKASVAHAKGNIASILIFMIILSLSMSLGTMLTCGLGAFVLPPIALVAMCHFYEQERDAIAAAANAAQIPMQA